MQSRIKKRCDFLKVANKGGFCPSSTVIVQYLAIPLEQDNEMQLEQLKGLQLRVGFTASKRVGNAVMRNRAKRRLREAFEIVSDKLELKNCWVVLIAKTATITTPYDQILRDLTYALGRCQSGKFAPPRESSRPPQGKTSRK